MLLFSLCSLGRLWSLATMCEASKVRLMPVPKKAMDQELPDYLYHRVTWVAELGWVFCVSVTAAFQFPSHVYCVGQELSPSPSPLGKFPPPPRICSWIQE